LKGKLLPKSCFKLRSCRGNAIVLALAFSAFLLLFGYAAFQLANFFGASEEVRNSVDAGALNVASKSIFLKVPAIKPYDDCVDLVSQIGLTNINRVWGKALLINANVQSMEKESLSGATATKNASSAMAIAQEINDSLFRLLTGTSSLSSMFNQLGSLRHSKMLAGSSSVSATSNTSWPKAALLRGRSSNLTFDQTEIPPDAGVSIPQVSIGNEEFVPGYTPIAANKNFFSFVSFIPGDKPQLVSQSLFEVNRIDTNPIPNIINPIPNGFSATGSVTNTSSGLVATAFGLANPQKQYTLSIPHSYVSIKITNEQDWYVEGNLVAQGQYTLQPLIWHLAPYSNPNAFANVTLKNGAVIHCLARVGGEYAQPVTLWDVLKNGGGDLSSLWPPMVQRIKEIKPDFTANELIALLKSQRITHSSSQYLIYPKYSSGDATNPTITIGPVSSIETAPSFQPGVAGSGNGLWINPPDDDDKQAVLLSNPMASVVSPWIAPAYQPDGIEKLALTQADRKDNPNYDWPFYVSGAPEGTHYAILKSNVYWEPDSGFYQCLGQLRIAHRTNCYFAVIN